MFAKIQITGTIELKTGMHIGGSSAYAPIGAVDAPVMRDASTNLPMIPGSSLKGKMRSLLAKEYNDGSLTIGSPDDDPERVRRLFGNTKNDKHPQCARLLFSDMFMPEDAIEDLRKSKGVQNVTEVKFENTINRATSQANPRQIERVIRGAVFNLDLVYEAVKSNEILEDMETLATGLKLMKLDYIGGSGSRGYGKIIFKDVKAEWATDAPKDTDPEIIDKCNKLLEEGTK